MLNSSRISTTWRDMLTRVPSTPLVAFLLVSLPLTAIAIYYLPYPDSVPGIFCWLVVQSLGFLLLLSQQAWKSVGLEQYLNGVLVIASVMVVFSTLYIGRVVFNHSSLPAFRMVIADLVVSFICLATFVLLRRQVSATLHRFLSNRFVLVAQFIIAFAFPVAIIGLLPDKWAEAEELAKHGPAAPWQVQLSVAQTEAARHDKEAVLEAVTAFQVYAQHPDYMTALYTHFHFITPSGERFSVAFDDIDPQGMVSVEVIDPPNEKQKPTQQQLQSLKSATSTIKISPRDALQRTIPEVLPVARQHTDPRIVLYVEGWMIQDRPDDERNLPVFWTVKHKIVVVGGEQRHFLLDPATGEIVERITVGP